MANPSDIWEKKLQDPIETPMSLPLEFLKAITCQFSTEKELGRGGYGVVYKGVLSSGKIIAVKKIHDIHLLDDTKFRNEISSLMGIKHQNIVQFVGYCAESTWEAMKLQGSGNYILAEIPKRLLCFEYVCNASLDKYISDESSGLEWNVRYDIIKGICGGLHYLHEQCHIVHLDLKPENILLDAAMVPKIADFGLSRIFGEEKSRIITENRAGSRGYMALEYLIQGVVSMKADIFSLGVIIIEIVTGRRDYPLSVAYFQHINENDSPRSTETSNQQFIEKILHIWRNRLQKSEGYMVKLEQIRVCAELGIQCIDFYPGNRPVMQHIIDRLDEVNIMDGTIKTGMSSTWVIAQLCSPMSKNMVQDQVPAVSIPASKTGNLSKDNSIASAIPNAFLCPISLTLMEDPVVVTTGQTYDRRSITMWLSAGHDTCPRTEQKLVNKSLTPNNALHGLIAKWCEANGLGRPKRSAQLRGNASAAPCTASEHDTVTELLQKLSSQNVLDQRGAAGTLRELAKRNAENRACIGHSGSIPILVSLLSTTDDVSTQVHVVTALLNVSIHEENKARLVYSGAVPGLVQVLESGSTEEARENAAVTLFSLSVVDEYKVMIGTFGSIPPLVLMLSTGSQQGRKDAAAALFNLCIYHGNKSKAVRAGLVPILLELVTGSGNGIMDESIAILSILSSIPEGKEAISGAAAIPCLVRVIRNESLRSKENAAAILLQLCNGEGEQQQQDLAEAREQGIVSLLVELAERGTERGKVKATRLLELMNNNPRT